MSLGLPALLALKPNLPAQCEPTGPFLRQFSSTFHTCVPTPLAFTSTFLGSLSILAWLFAQLPQIFKNYRLKSTSGLSIYFLVEWCLGDMSNLIGAVLTHQATWQIIIGAYYCFVDIALVSQWFWYEGLKRGTQASHLWKSQTPQFSPGNGDDMQELAVADKASSWPHLHVTSGKGGVFPWPNYGTTNNSSDQPQTSSPARIIRSGPRRTAVNPLPSPSPRSALLLTVVVALCSISVSASPTTPLDQSARGTHKPQSPPLGTIISWMSTILYLLSRLPQLIKNFRRRSTAGLSPLLFLAAFSGNFFYSASLLFNPCLWQDFAPYGGQGWVGPEGSRQIDWMWSALPFFLGAAGVLVMDGAVGVQFWLWGGGSESAELRDLQRAEQADGVLDDLPNRQVPTGWMRGWVPSGSISSRLNSLRRFSPLLVPADAQSSKTGENESLLRGEAR